jgi:hypothetical protein
MNRWSETAEKAIAAYGGVEFWSRASFIEAELSARGLAFTLKRRPFFDHATIRMDIGRPFSRLTPIGSRPGIAGVLDAHDVRLENADGKVIERRADARSFFPYGRRLFSWDDLDMAYFANYATWNYLTLPRLLMDERIAWTEPRPGHLVASFPNTIPTHSTRQEFFFDTATGRLRQHNYNANIITPLATAANVVMEHDESDGILYTKCRLVTPRTRSGGARKGPILIDLRIHSFHIE